MFWILLSVAMCTGLAVRLLFWSDEHRRESRWYYRVLLFLVTVYCAMNVIDFLYAPTTPVSPTLAIVHAALFFGAFIIRPEHLPWNGNHDLASETRSARTDIASRLRYGFRRTGLHGRQGRPEGRERRAQQGTHRIR